METEVGNECAVRAIGGEEGKAEAGVVVLSHFSAALLLHLPPFHQLTCVKNSVIPASSSVVFGAYSISTRYVNNVSTCRRPTNV